MLYVGFGRGLYSFEFIIVIVYIGLVVVFILYGVLRVFGLGKKVVWFCGFNFGLISSCVFGFGSEIVLVCLLWVFFFYRDGF